jgi:hypothetical protein
MGYVILSSNPIDGIIGSLKIQNKKNRQNKLYKSGSGFI